MNFALLVALACWCASALGASGPACSNGAAYTSPRTWRFAVARPGPSNADGQRVVNSILTMVSQTTTPTSGIYLPYDTVSFSSNSDVYDDGCDVSPATAITKADALYTAIAGNAPHVIIGGSCSEFNSQFLSRMKADDRQLPMLISYQDYNFSTSNSALFPSFIRSNIITLGEATAVYQLLQYHSLYSVAVLCSVGAHGASFCSGFDTVVSQYGVDALISRAFPEAYNAADAATKTMIDTTLDAIRTQQRTVIILYLKLDMCQAVMRALYASGMYGQQYHFILSSELHTSRLFVDEATYLVANGAFLVSAEAGLPGYTNLQFQSAYKALAFATNGDSPEDIGMRAYDASLFLVKAARNMRTECENSTVNATIASFLRNTPLISGADGDIVLQTTAATANNRRIGKLFTIWNVQALSFVSVGTISNDVVSFSGTVVFPGFTSSPIKQWRIGMLISNHTAALRNAPAMAKWAISRINSFTTSSSLSTYQGREQLIMLPSQTLIDDCSVSSGLALKNLKEIVYNSNTFSVTPFSRNPIAIIGPSCTQTLGDSTYVAALSGLGIPLVVIGATDLTMPSVSSLPNAVRISIAQSTETTLLLSVAAFYGWLRTSVAYTTDNIGSTLYSTYAKIAPSYGIRISNTFAISAATTDAQFNTFWDSQVSTTTLTTLCLLGTGANPVNSAYFLSRLLARNMLGKQQLLVGGAFAADAANFPASVLSAAQGTLFTDSSFDLAGNAALSATRTAWLAAQPSATEIDHLPYVVDAVSVIVAALTAARAASTDPHTDHTTFAKQLHLVNLPGVLGPVNFTAASSDRLSMPNFYRVKSFRSGGGAHDVVGTSDAYNSFVLTANPTAWMNGNALPTPACTRGSVGTYTSASATAFGVRALCVPCLDGTYSLTGQTVCTPCTAQRICPIGTWAKDGFDTSVAFLAQPKTTVPVVLGPYTSLDDITWFDVRYALIGAGLFVGTTVVVVAAMLVCPKRAGPFLQSVDGFTADHPVENGTPLVIRATVVGGYCSILCALLMLAALVYFGTRYQTNKYTVQQAQLLGVTTFLNPDPLRVTVTFYSIDNVPECALTCTRLNVAVGITGTFTCTPDTVLTTCTVVFVSSPSLDVLPLEFQLNVNFMNAHVHAFTVDIVGTTFAGKPYGYSRAVRANDGQVLFGYNASTVLGIDLQPYTFKGSDDLDPARAPKSASGYYVLPRTLKVGPQEGPSAWVNADAYQKNAGAYLTLQFVRKNAVNSFYLTPISDIITVLSNMTALGVALALYITRGGLRFLEALPFAARAVRGTVERWTDPDAEARAEKEADLARERRIEEEAKEEAAAEALVQTADQVALNTMKATVAKQADEIENARRAAIRDADRVAARVAELKQQTADRALAYTQAVARAAVEAELDGAVKAGGASAAAKALDGSNEAAAANAFPWKGVVTELITHFQPRDLVSSLAYTAERDLGAMKVLAEVMAPYLHQRAMELRPASSVRAGGGTSGAAIRAASMRPK